MKCDCGETDKPHHSKEKCIHLREAEERAKASQAEDSHEEKDPAHVASVAEEQGCCCHHGGKCSCAVLKKEDDDGTSPPHGQPAVQKPRLDSHKSEGSLTVFANGHHKPVHRKNFAAHECGMPYKLPMPRSHTDQGVTRSACRSTDNLRLNTLILDQNAGAQYPFGVRRLSKSEQTSPRLQASNFGGLGDYVGNRSTAFDFAASSQSTSNDQLNSTSSQNSTFLPLEPTSGVADSSFDPWSAYPSADSHTMPNNNPFGVWPTSTDMSGLAHPALTAASSGTQSEIDEVPGIDDWYEPGMPSIQEDVLPVDIEALMGTSAPQQNRHSLPPNFFGNAGLGMASINPAWQTPTSTFDESNDKFKPTSNPAPANFDNAWQMPTFPPVTKVPYRTLAGLPISRQASQTTGAMQTPGEDIISSLFPGMNYEDDSFTPETSQPFENTTTKTSSFASGLAPTSLDYDPFSNADNSMTSQPWTDGSMSIPNDGFASFPFDQDFSNQEFPNSWSQ